MRLMSCATLTHTPHVLWSLGKRGRLALAAAVLTRTPAQPAAARVAEAAGTAAGTQPAVPLPARGLPGTDSSLDRPG